MTIDTSGLDYMMEYESIELPCKPEEERRIVQELTSKAESNLRQGNLYYVISNKWFTEWQKYTGQVEGAYLFDDPSVVSVSLTTPNIIDRPGSIDNSDIVEIGECYKDDPQVRRTLEEGCDYVIVPEEVWEKLFKWYNGGPVLQRNMIAVGEQQKQFSVEVFPLCVRIIDSLNQNELHIRISKKASLRDLYEKICRLKSLNPEKAVIWDYFNKKKQTVLNPSDRSLEEANIQMDQDVLLEMQNDRLGVDSTGNGLALVPVEPTRSPLSIAGGPTMSNGNSIGYSSTIYQSTFNPAYGEPEDVFDVSKGTSKGVEGGLAGLQNLGNTCFMNSALQCLVHTPHLAKYFLQDYSDEINRENPLGMHGELAVAFGELLRKLWSSGETSIAPRSFKGKLSRFAPQFSGYNQHDSQELLAFLLDGLHEDLNRIKHKPYIETKDSEGRPDEEVANEFWRYHRARNDSAIVDICQGQYKSTLICPICNKISITFDPFMYLSLPLPSITTRSITVTVFCGDGTGLPMPFTVTVLKQGCCKDLSQALGTACCLGSDEYLLLAEVCGHKIFRYLENPSESLARIKDDEYIVAYRLPKKAADLTKLEICHRFQDKVNKLSSEMKLFLTPLVTVLEDPQSGEDIDRAVNRILSPLKKKALFASPPTQNGKESTSNFDVTETLTNSSMQSGPTLQTETLTNKSMQSEPALQTETLTNNSMQSGPALQTETLTNNSMQSGPALRTETLTNNSMQSGPALQTETLTNNSMQSEPALQLADDMELDGVSSNEMSFHVCITGDKGFGCRPIMKDSPITPGRLVKVMLDWTDKENESYDVSLLKDLPAVQKSDFFAKISKQEDVSLFTCLDAFLKEEPLGPDDMWYCPRCKEHRQASKKLDLWRLPDVLVVHLKRFSYSRWLKNKLDTFVNFPIQNLDLSKYVKNDASAGSNVYELYAISNHYGGLGGGHYSAYCKLIDENRWYHFDDSHVSAINESEIRTSDAYVLFYQRVNHTNSSETTVGEPTHVNGAY